MKFRVGFVSTKRDDLDKLKKEFPDLILIYAQNVMDLNQHASSKNLDCVIIMNTSQVLSKEFVGYYNYLRQKPNFKQTPIATISDAQYAISIPISDPKVRAYTTTSGVFAPLIDYFSVLSKQNEPEIILSEERTEEEFKNAIARKFNKAANLNSRPATLDESHMRFVSQATFEIASNLYWVKYSCRILDHNMDAVRIAFGTSNDQDLTTSLDNLQKGIFSSFKEHIEEELNYKGAMYFKTTDQLGMSDKAPYLKKAKSKHIVFESTTLMMAIEVIRYL